MEREKLEKLRRKADKDKAEAAKRAAAAKGDKKVRSTDMPATSILPPANFASGFWDPFSDRVRVLLFGQ